jgi:iron complex outermembrane recepter protein
MEVFMAWKSIQALFYCAVFLTSAAAARAQTAASARGAIIGVVVDSATGKAIVAAQVQLLPTHAGDLTHADGRFELRGVAPGVYTLAVERIGYRRVSQHVQVAAGATTDVRLVLAEAAVELGAFVVTGTMGPRARQDVISPVSTISGAELDRRAAPTVAALLESKPGLATTSLGPATAHPVIRGLSGDRILVLEDGQRPGDMSSTGGDHAIAIDASTARRIEVVRGPMSLLYGSSALGGVVNVVRDEIPTSLPHELQGSLALQSASGNRSVNGAGSAIGTLGRLAVRAEGSVLNSGDLRTPVGPIRGTDARIYDTSIGIALPNDRRHAGVSYRFYANDYGVPGGFVGGHQTDVDITMRRHTVRFASELHRDKDLWSSLQFDAGYTHYNHEETEPSGALGTSFGQDLLQAEIGARHSARGVLREGATGVRVQYRDIRTGGTLHTPSTYDFTAAGFAIEEAGTETFRLQAGLRYDWAHYVPRDTASFVVAGGELIPVRVRSFGAVSGSAGVLWLATKQLRVGASLSRAYRTPDFNELYSNGPHLAANSFDVGDPSLRQETGTGIDLFVRWSSDRLSGELAAYRNVLNDYIFPSSRGRAELGAQGEKPRFQFTNEDARFVGAEAELDAALTRFLHLEATGSLVNALFTSQRAPIPILSGIDTSFVPASRYPPLIPPAQARIALRVEHRRYFAGGGVKLVDRQDRTGDFETATPGYALLDLTAGLRLTRGSVLHTITLRADNLLNKEYRDHLSRLKDILPGPGRSVSLLYRMVF